MTYTRVSGDWYDPDTGFHETEEGVCMECGDMAVRPYFCAVHADEWARDCIEDEWWNLIHPPNDDPRHHADMEAWFRELHPGEEDVHAA